MYRTDENLQPKGRYRGVAIGLILVAEVIAIAVLYQFFAKIECMATDSEGVCRFLRSLVARALVMSAVLLVLVLARRGMAASFLAAVNAHSGARWVAVHLAGVALLLLPLGMAAGRDLGAMFGQALLPFALGAVLAAVGGLLWIAPLRAWNALLAQDRYVAIPVLALAALMPDIADWVLPIWTEWQVLTDLTFLAVYGFLTVFSNTVFADPPGYIIGVETFAVHIARQCSGVEGFALVTGFVALYAFVFRKDIRPLRFWTIVLPCALLLSWVLNIVRIGTLVLIGARISPDLAVDGFHSYAGWMFFTLLALGIVFAVRHSPFLHREPQRFVSGTPLRMDPLAAYILPFVVFMVASVMSQALFPHPELGYPLRVLGMGAALLVFAGVYRRLPWRPDAVSIGSGLVVGVLWVVLAGSPSGESELARSLATLGTGLLAFWVAMRLIGTVLLVPLVEELFFRGYVLARIDRGGMALRLLGIAVSSLLFAALHGRWIEAGLAGVVFSLAMLRRGRVTDAVLSHMAANFVVAAAALLRNDFSLI